jgi:hypothetical protein
MKVWAASLPRFVVSITDRDILTQVHQSRRQVLRRRHRVVGLKAMVMKRLVRRPDGRGGKEERGALLPD